MDPIEQRPNYVHNCKVLSQLTKGDLVKFPRRGYDHWAVYCGDNNVVHLQGIKEQDDNVQNLFSVDRKKYIKARAVVDDFWAAAKRSEAEKDNYLDHKFCPQDADVIVQIAMDFTKMVALPYHLLLFNCEHFATLCRYGAPHSDQAGDVEKFLQKAAAGGARIAFRIKKLRKKMKTTHN